VDLQPFLCLCGFRKRFEKLEDEIVEEVKESIAEE
jgi:hypothetical protein